MASRLKMARKISFARNFLSFYFNLLQVLVSNRFFIFISFSYDARATPPKKTKQIKCAWDWAEAKKKIDWQGRTGEFTVELLRFWCACVCVLRHLYHRRCRCRHRRYIRRTSLLLQLYDACNEILFDFVEFCLFVVSFFHKKIDAVVLHLPFIYAFHKTWYFFSYLQTKKNCRFCAVIGNSHYFFYLHRVRKWLMSENGAISILSAI